MAELVGTAPTSTSAPAPPPLPASTRRSVPDPLPGGLARGVAWNIISEAVQDLIGRWGVVQVAVSDEWGGPTSRDKYDTFLDDLLDNLVRLWDEDKVLNWESVDYFFNEVLAQDFNIDFDDGGRETEALARRVEFLFMEGRRGEVKEAAMAAYEAFGKDSAAADAGLLTEEEKTRLDEKRAAAAAAAPPAHPKPPPSDDEDDGEDDDEEEEEGAAGGGGEADDGGWTTV